MITTNEETLASNTALKRRKPHTALKIDKNIKHVKAEYDMIVFCHLRWDFVFQRPQHLISRLSQSYSILLIEEPVAYAEGEKFTARIRQVTDSITVLQPCVDTIEEIADVLKKQVSVNTTPIGWFYSAAFVPLLETVKFCKIVYDCMDELSLFKGAPQQLITREKELISKADLVFTGGKSLYEAKRHFKTNTYCFPSSVDRTHFDVSNESISIPEDIAHLPKPVIGYYGVIDERIDYALLKETARANPGCSFVMIGPLAKVTPEELPEAENLHFLGIRSYNRLPEYLQGFDIAMMPFAMNDSTKYISPTKTLEYMAGGKPIISTPVHDVVRDYNHCVKIVTNAAEFTSAINTFTADLNKSYLRAYNSILDSTSWDATAIHMIDLLKTKDLT